MQESPTPANTLLAEALQAKKPRFFRADKGAAKGQTGPEDTGRFADHLMVLQECAALLGERTGMRSLVHAVLHDGSETAGFCRDAERPGQEAGVAGAIVNRRVSVREFLQSIRDFGKG
ncbi:MAG TPA: hypothetical protein PLA50_09090 [Bacteroidia bacterium]|nr:hypothetical protein [Bacteroidia bacterium]